MYYSPLSPLPFVLCVILFVVRPLSICNSYIYYIIFIHVQTTSFDGVFLLLAFHCIALICNYCFLIVVNKISIYLTLLWQPLANRHQSKITRRKTQTMLVRLTTKDFDFKTRDTEAKKSKDNAQWNYLHVGTASRYHPSNCQQSAAEPLRLRLNTSGIHCQLTSMRQAHCPPSVDC